ncbi:DNA/RNA nuclease SfsA [Desulfovibrio sp. UCD-KL4C]|uniref:DNA/RNA nuclease SfsA n=1 Tax=Desulfovibrio sp. UCD-KL4C TaxID=2578120 RepID=UPI0025C49C68|nr:DNA/RNA nuclease SfsA [Desulfovibrio sp. UCD-KL4C]
MSKPLIVYPKGCRKALFLKRYKRFTVEALLDGDIISIHTNNTGSMLGLLREGQEIFISPALNPARKLKWTLEMVNISGAWVGVNTSVPNKMIQRAFEENVLPELKGYTSIKREAVVGKSRLDAKFTDESSNLPDLWVECKNVTLVEDDVACFPDAPTERGQKHLEELMDLASKGYRVAMFFFIQRNDGKCFGPADFIDQKYATLFKQALAEGVECWPYQASLSEKGISVGEKMKF